jgi:predicted amidophosphoribosyltransferase
MRWLEYLWPWTCAGCEAPDLGWLCPDCRPEGPFAIDPPEGSRSGVALAPYAGPLGRAVRRAKYTPSRALALHLAGLATRIAPVLPEVDVLIPVPSRLGSRVTRGFATASVLASGLSSASGVAVLEALEVGPGSRQAALSRRERRANVAGRFHARRDLTGLRVLLVDDVVTTGATATACADAARLAGATDVHLVAWCAARVGRALVRASD